MVGSAKKFINVPYLWGGRSYFGIDCSALVQLVYKIHGIALPRDADKQAELGEARDFVEESEPGDLASMMTMCAMISAHVFPVTFLTVVHR